MPYSDDYYNVPDPRYRKKKKRFTLKRFLKDARRTVKKLLRAAARGIYRFCRYLCSLPPRHLAIGGGGVAVLLVAIIIVASATNRARLRQEAANELAGSAALINAGTEAAAFSGAAGTENAPTGEAALTPIENGTELIDGIPIETEAAIHFTEVAEGDDGAIITEIQTRLMALGYMDSDEPTEHFGPLTESALKKFQRHNGLSDDGICGESTYEMLGSEAAKEYVMQLGDSGEDVKSVQTRLYELGYLDNKANITSTFGEKTEAAAQEFQKKNDLKADGKVGEKTISMLYSEDVVGKVYKLGDENAVIKQCQTVLKKLGYITFKADGVMGKSTVTGIKAFQRSNGLTVDGTLGPETRDLILSGNAQAMVLQLGDYGTEVKNMQTYLAKLNYIKSANATGYFGAITEDAVKAFQKRNSLTADGKVGAVTLSIMKSTKAKKAVAPVTDKKESSSGSSSSGSSGSSSSSGSSGTVADVANKTGVEKMIAIAESKLGCKYVTGAKGPNTFDCSGFVYYCMRQAGVSGSYQTSIMWRTCSRYQRISSMGSLARGDILVFSGSTNAQGHVGIYLGGGKMIDAGSSAGQVRLSSTVLKSGGYWSQHFLMAYRVF